MRIIQTIIKKPARIPQTHPKKLVVRVSERNVTARKSAKMLPPCTRSLMTGRRETNWACRLALTGKVSDDTVVEVFDGSFNSVNTQLIIYTHSTSVIAYIYSSHKRYNKRRERPLSQDLPSIEDSPLPIGLT